MNDCLPSEISKDVASLPRHGWRREQYFRWTVYNYVSGWTDDPLSKPLKYPYKIKHVRPVSGNDWLLATEGVSMYNEIMWEY